MIGKILCKLGIHKWEVVENVTEENWGAFFKCKQARCKRCDKLKRGRNIYEKLNLIEEGEVIHCPIYISTDEYKKMFVIQSKPKHEIWFKDKEITIEELAEILNKIT